MRTMPSVGGSAQAAAAETPRPAGNDQSGRTAGRQQQQPHVMCHAALYKDEHSIARFKLSLAG
jgi:hypothetical protein